MKDESSLQLVLVARDLGVVGEEPHEASGRVLVGVHEPSHDPDEPAGDHRRPPDPRLDPCTTSPGLSFPVGVK